MKILIIDDDAAVRFTLQSLLELEGHETVCAASADEGVSLLHHEPEVILCDVNMPGRDGFEVVAAVRSRPETSAIPFIFITGESDRASQRRGMELAASDYLTKPFSEAEVLNAIAACVQRQRPWRERVQQLVDERRRQAAAEWSHELLTPLNAIVAGLDLLEMEVAEGADPAGVRELIEIVRSGADRQERLSRKLMRFFELERMQRDPPDRRDDWICSADAAAAELHQRSADMHLHCVPGTVRLPDDLLGSAVHELVANACLFSSPGTPIEISGAVESGCYRITVTDRGRGMTAEQRARIVPFTQYDKSVTAQPGLGLGLSIVQATALLGQGTFSLHAGAAGVGLRAEINLPLAGS